MQFQTSAGTFSNSRCDIITRSQHVTDFTVRLRQGTRQDLEGDFLLGPFQGQEGCQHHIDMGAILRERQSKPLHVIIVFIYQCEPTGEEDGATFPDDLLQRPLDRRRTFSRPQFVDMDASYLAADQGRKASRCQAKFESETGRLAINFEQKHVFENRRRKIGRIKIGARWQMPIAHTRQPQRINRRELRLCRLGRQGAKRPIHRPPSTTKNQRSYNLPRLG